MSTYYAPIPDISFDQLFDGRLEKYGIKEEIVASPTEGTRYLVGCDGFYRYTDKRNGTCTFTRRGCVPWSIFDAIAEQFKVELVSITTAIGDLPLRKSGMPGRNRTPRRQTKRPRTNSTTTYLNIYAANRMAFCRVQFG
jgi:hypothetical protein